MPSKIKKRGETSYQLNVPCGYDSKGKQLIKSKTVKAANITEAKRLYNEFATDVQNGNVANCGKMTLAQFYDFYKENYSSKNHQPTTIVYNDSIFARIKEALGHLKLDKIEPRHLLAFYKNLAEPGIKKIQQKKASSEVPNEGTPKEAKKETEKEAPKLSTTTIKKYHTLLHTLLSKAVKWNLIPSNPAERVEPPKVEKKPKQIYSQEELAAFLEAIEEEPTKYRLMVLLALAGGLRREEIFGLEWKHINFEERTAHIDQASVYESQIGTITKETKNASSNRIVSLPPSVIALLKEHKAEQNKKRLLLGDKWINTDRLFTQWNGKEGNPCSFYTWIRRFAIEHQLPPITPHTLRHMAATYLITEGTDIRTVSGKLGHAQTSTTMNIYSHLLKSAEQETANTMENFLENIKKKSQDKEKKQVN